MGIDILKLIDMQSGGIFTDKPTISEETTLVF